MMLRMQCIEQAQFHIRCEAFVWTGESVNG